MIQRGGGGGGVVAVGDGSDAFGFRSVVLVASRAVSE